MNPSQEDLKKLQDAIYRDKVERARSMTPEERLNDVFELCNSVMLRMIDGAMWQLKTDSLEEGKKEVARRIEKLRRLSDITNSRKVS